MSDSSERRTRTREERRLLGAAIRRARGELTQAALGDLLGEQQTAISRWEVGEVDIDFSLARRIELALQLPFGWIARDAGFIDFDRLLETEADSLIRVGHFQSYDDAAVEIEAAATLGLGVRVYNRLVPTDDDEVATELWVVAIYTEPDERP